MHKYIFTDEEYGKILDNFVVGCVDVAVIYENKILLERRVENPIQGEWWIFGGRMMKGESFKETATRSVSRELGVNLETGRFVEVGTYNLIWPTRREPVISNGCHHLLVAHSVDVTDEEYGKINQTIEKSGMAAKWLSYEEVLASNCLKEILDIVAKVLTRS
jgi:colanic acid biosynthesis protein WcaH